MNPVPTLLLWFILSVSEVAGKSGVNSAATGVLTRSASCGDYWQVIYEDQKAILTSPGWSQGQYQSYTYCNWTLQVTAQENENKTVQLKLVDSAIEYEASCNNDYLAVYDYDTDDLLGKFCGTSCDGTIINAPEAKVRVVFYSNERYTDKGFQIEWSRVDRDPYTSCRCSGNGLCLTCGGRSDVDMLDPGVLAYPVVVPGQMPAYTSFARCSWSITVTDGMFTGFFIGVLDIEESVDCSNDALVIRKTGEDNAIGKLCGNKCVESVVAVTSHRSQVYFSSDESVQHKGFLLVYGGTPKDAFAQSMVWCNCESENDGCSGEGVEYVVIPITTTTQAPTNCGGIYADLSGQLYSPNYPQNYPHNIECHYNIMVPQGYHLYLTFVSFVVEYHSTCASDALTMYEPYYERFCGVKNGDTLVVPSNIFISRFTSDRSLTYSGFHIVYQALPSGETISPPSPSPGPNPSPVTTPTPTTLAPTCGGVFTELSGDIFSPNYPNNYPTNILCRYNITVPEGYILNITLVSFFVEPSTGCLYDHLTIYEPYYQQLCGMFSGETVILPSNHVFAEFVSDNVATFSGFHINYQAIGNGPVPPVDTGCGGNLTGMSGQFSSPGFPNGYPPDTQCFWDIIVLGGMAATVFFINALDLEGVVDCSFDSLVIRAFGDDTNIGRFCGNAAVGSTVYVFSAHSRAIFTSDRNIESAGFLVSYLSTPPVGSVESFVHCQTDAWYEGCAGQNPVYAGIRRPPIICGGNYTNSTGDIYSPNYPDDYPNDATCPYNIIVPEGYHIFITAVSFNVEVQGDCLYDALTIQEPISMPFCGVLTSETFVIPDNTVSAVFTTDGSVALSGFHLHYQAIEPGNLPPINFECGANISDATSGVITSPGFPKPYPVGGLQCVWLLTVEQKLRIRFTIHSFELVGGCKDVLTLRDGGYYGYDRARRYCQGNVPPTFESDSNVIVLIFTSINDSAAGFNISYESFDPANETAHVNPEVPCGVVPLSTGLSPHIVGGQDAVRHSYPWQIYIYRNNGFHCGGNIVHESWILTAAHCVENWQNYSYEIVCGAHNMELFEPTVQRRGVPHIIPVPSFNDSTFDNDIALMRLDKPLRWTEAVRPICIPDDMASVGTPCIVSGWGRTEDRFPDILQYVGVPILDTDECRQSYVDGSYTYNEITDNMFCAGFYEGGKDTCQGDSGGPVACDIGGRYELMGISSWGAGCAREYFPGIYTRVVNYLEFIANSTNGDVLPVM